MTRASLVLIATLAARATYAQEPAPSPADAAYQEARRLYDLREWDASIAKFKEAYRLRPDAPSLFNIAQANRLKGDCVEALSFYRTYKRNFPAEKNIDKVDKFITEMDTCVKEGKSKPTTTGTTTTGTEPTTTGTTTTGATTTGTVPTTTGITTTGTTTGTTGAASGTGVTTTVTTASKDSGKKLRVAGLVVGGAGVLSLGASVFFGIRARGAANDAEDGSVGETWNPAIQSRGESAARNFKITAIAGGALLVTGGVLYMIGRRGSREASHVALVPHAEGASLVWGAGF